jgi:beta-glucanase (GH16 family)
MRTIAFLASAVLVTVLVLALILQSTGRSSPSDPPGSAGASATARPGPTSPGASAALAPTPLPSGYTFYDDFTGTTLSPVWAQDFNFRGIENTWSLSQATVQDGILSIRANRAGSGGWVSALLDTKTTWTQLYGHFEARMKIPVGNGLWPAFWSYRSGGGGESEIDTMEVCANPLGTNSGNDASSLHTTVRWSGGQAGHDFQAPDLSADFHIYGVDWRPDHISFTLDGTEVFRFTQKNRIPTAPLPLIVNLAVGGDWCGPSDSSTPDGSTLQVDWIRASP